MPGTSAFEVEGLIVQVLPNGTYWAELPNGHRLLAFVPGKGRVAVGQIAPGSKVRLQLSPFDLSEGRIILDSRKI
jgi:translation initiation factor IF-1